MCRKSLNQSYRPDKFIVTILIFMSEIRLPYPVMHKFDKLEFEKNHMPCYHKKIRFDSWKSGKLKAKNIILKFKSSASKTETNSKYVAINYIQYNSKKCFCSPLLLLIIDSPLLLAPSLILGATYLPAAFWAACTACPACGGPPSFFFSAERVS